MTREQHIKYWLEGAAHDLEAAESLFVSKKYDWCLFLAHLVLEKTLKAYYVSQNDAVPPKTHNLVKIAELSSLTLSNEKKVFLDEVNDFNLEARYPDHKNAFYKICTRDFTEKYFTEIKESYQWLKSLIQ